MTQGVSGFRVKPGMIQGVSGFRIKSGMTHGFDDLFSTFHAMIKVVRGQRSGVKAMTNHNILLLLHNIYLLKKRWGSFDNFLLTFNN